MERTNSDRAGEKREREKIKQKNAEITVFINFTSQIFHRFTSHNRANRLALVLILAFYTAPQHRERQRKSGAEWNGNGTPYRLSKLNRFQKHTLNQEWAKQRDRETERKRNCNSLPYRLLYTMLYKLAIAIWNVDTSDVAIMIFNRLKLQLQHLQYIRGSSERTSHTPYSPLLLASISAVFILLRSVSQFHARRRVSKVSNLQIV